MHSATAPKQTTSIQHQRFQKTVDAGVLLRAQNGDQAAYTVLYQTYSQAVHTLAYGICGNRHCAEDVLHNTYIKLIDKLPSFEGRAPLGMWIRQIAVNESLMYLRKHKKHKVVVSSDEFDFFDDYTNAGAQDGLGESFPSCKSNFTDALDDGADMSKLLLKLPEESRMVLWLKEVEGYTHKEIADMMDKTPSYSKSIVARSLQFLRARLTPEKEYAC
jgi:RNA polymerase sigma-70 factor (ECF subfamily)